jgi:hypothetical protein
MGRRLPRAALQQGERVMPIFLNYTGIPGEVTTKGHEK